MLTKPPYANNRGSCLSAAAVAAAPTLLDVGAGDGGEVDVGDSCSPAYVSIRQHTSAYVSIRQHTSAYVSIRQHTLGDGG
jgi:hypothetical protein